ncbi:hypothetical protein [Streptomyces sp. NPDC058572]
MAMSWPEEVASCCSAASIIAARSVSGTAMGRNRPVRLPAAYAG